MPKTTLVDKVASRPRKKRTSYSHQNVVDALQRNALDGKSIRKAAKECNMPKTTLVDKVASRPRKKRTSYSHQNVVDALQRNALDGKSIRKAAKECNMPKTTLVDKAATTPRKYRANYSQQDIDDALQRIAVDGMSIRKAAVEYNIPRSTLVDKFSGRVPVDARIGKLPYLTVVEENKISEWIRHMAKIGYGQTKMELRQVVKTILDHDQRETPFRNNLPGLKWTRLFMARHPELSKEIPQPLGKGSAPLTKKKIDSWFSEFENYMQEAEAMSILEQPSRIFTCDILGFPLCGKMGRVLHQEGSKSVSRLSKKDRSQITLLCTISADGKFLPPTLIFPGQRFRDNPLEGGPEHTFLGRSKNGRMDGEIFHEFIEKSFVPFLNRHSVHRPVLLLVDGHRSHLTLEVADLCHKHKIILYCLPAKARHILQPCDLTIYGPLKLAWEKAERDYMLAHLGEVVQKFTFARVFRPAWEEVSSNPQLPMSGFEEAGIFPFTKVYNTDKLGPIAAVGNSTDPAIEVSSSAMDVPSPSAIEVPSSSAIEVPTTSAIEVPSHSTIESPSAPSIETSSEASPARRDREAAHKTSPPHEDFVNPALEQQLVIPSVKQTVSTRKRKRKRNAEQLPECNNSDAVVQMKRKKFGKKRKKFGKKEEEKEKKRKKKKKASVYYLVEVKGNKVIASKKLKGSNRKQLSQYMKDVRSLSLLVFAK
ncbi:uncharacterized protein [Diadema antillarum]|uniref:uncharacterized protein n=1 Tax=Diadema antillarum TaxID=105358 RepID=UPI003A888357